LVINRKNRHGLEAPLSNLLPPAAGVLAPDPHLYSKVKTINFSFRESVRLPNLNRFFAANDSERDDYILDPEPEADGYYDEVDPNRVKLISNVVRYVEQKRKHPYYKQKVTLLPEQTKGTFSTSFF